MDTDIKALQSRVDKLESQLKTSSSQLSMQLLGNNPSTNFRNLLSSGTTVGGWFGLTNNGVTVNINGATNPFSGLANGLSVLDIASKYQATVDPFHFAIIDPANNPIGYLGGGLVGPQGFTNLFVGNSTDASSVLLAGASGVGTFTDGVNTTIITPTSVTLRPTDDPQLVSAPTTPGTITLAKLTGGGTNGSITVSITGRITSWVNPT